jgi:hypothetical protein
LRTLVLCCLLLVLAALPVFARGKPKRPPVPSPDSPYVAALAAANHFLRAWQTGDLESGLLLLSDAARHNSNEDSLRAYFSASQLRGFEIHRGKLLRTGRYTFPVVLFETTGPGPARRRYSDVIITETGNNDRAVDKLP